jgi:hypothetical protein
MKARLPVDRRIIVSETVFAEMVLWQLPEVTAERPHGYKYRLALVADGACVLRYDNETGKGDHIHSGKIERTYEFRGVDRLIADFLADVEKWLNANRNA